MSVSEQDIEIDVPIKGFIPVTMLDWEGKIAASLFVGGCNFRCPFCHNPDFVMSRGVSSIPWATVKDHLVKKQGWIDGVVIGGGEPTIQSGIISLIKAIKSLDIGVKLDTNGSRPRVLRTILDAGLVDFVAMDIKTTLTKYPLVTRGDAGEKEIMESIMAIIGSGVEHEFRTTAYPDAVDAEDMAAIAGMLASAGASKYAIQQFRPDRVLAESAARIEPFRMRYLEEAAQRCSTLLPTTLR